MKNLTIDDILALNPCKHYTRELVTELFDGRKTVNLLNIFEMDIGIGDKWWMLNRELAATQQRELACVFAREVLPIYEIAYPDDNRVRNCIEVAEDPESTPQQLQKAWDAAKAAARVPARAARAARTVAWDAAKAAAWDAAKAAAWNAAWAAAWASAWDAARTAAWNAARAAAGAAAGASAWVAARTAAWAAAWASAWDAQIETVIKYLENLTNTETE